MANEGGDICFPCVCLALYLICYLAGCYVVECFVCGYVGSHDRLVNLGYLLTIIVGVVHH